MQQELSHYGVKGMKWGVRKNYHEIRDSYHAAPVTLTSKRGEKISVVDTRKPIPAAMLGSVSPRFRDYLQRSHMLDISVNGVKVGDAACNTRRGNKEEMYFNWIGVDEEHRGKGYASSVFDAGVAYARSQGCKKIVLEVPGRAPDARHIYEKRGFKDMGLVSSKNDIWGGLTRMELDISKK